MIILNLPKTLVDITAIAGNGFVVAEGENRGN
jgi:hypothetical protein